MDSIAQKVIARVEALIAKANEVLKTKYSLGISNDYVDKGDYQSLRTQGDLSYRRCCQGLKAARIRIKLARIA